MKHQTAYVVAGLAALLLQASQPAWAQKDLLNMRGVDPKAPLARVGIDQKLDTKLPLDVPLRDEAGRNVHLGDYFGKRPVVFALVYYDCPMLCTQVLNGMVRALKVLTFTPGQEYDVVVVSFDAREKPPLAAAKKAAILREYGDSSHSGAFHFLTGDVNPLKRLTQAVGFRYVYDVHTSQYAHASAIYVVTPDGRMSRYFYGIEYSPKDLRFGLIEAAQNKIGNPVDQLLLFCYHYDPSTGKYTPLVTNILRAAGGATIFALGGFILIMLIRERKAKSDQNAPVRNAPVFRT
jgi:protein SCO1/2